MTGVGPRRGGDRTVGMIVTSGPQESLIMVVYLVGQLSEFFTNGTFAAALLCVGLAIGLSLGRRYRRTDTSDQDEVKRLVGVLSQMVDWTHGVADDMSEYRSVVSGVSNLFRNNEEPFDEQQRMETVGLLSQVVDANEQLQDRLNHAEEMLKEQAGEISTYMSEARTDSLTSLPNRRAFDEDLSRQLSEWKRHGRPLSVMMLDIDHFKKFNDTYGHQTGDAVLQQVAELLRETMRESDLVARFGGEEMSVVLPGTNAEEACLAAERARNAIETAVFAGAHQELHVTVSVGAAQCTADELGEALVKRADTALYAAKQAGRNQAFWHDGLHCRCVGGCPKEPASPQPEPVDSELAPLEQHLASTSDERVPAAVQPESGSEPRTVAQEPPAEKPGRTTESFAEVCQSLRQRLEEVSSSSSSGW